MTAITIAPSPELNAHGERLQSRRRSRVTVAAQRTATAIVAAVALTSLWTHRHQLSAAFHILNHLSWWWLTAALVFEGASLASYAVLQRRLLQAGNASISAVDMTRIAVAANAISASVPGGTAWSAPWSWRQLRRYGVDRALAAWVVLVAGALSSFALFVVVVIGAELAGNHGPVASLRWLDRALAAIPAAGCLLVLATRSRRSRRSPSASRLATLYQRTLVVRLSPIAWAASLTTSRRPRGNTTFGKVCCRIRSSTRCRRSCRRPEHRIERQSGV